MIRTTKDLLQHRGGGSLAPSSATAPHPTTVNVAAAAAAATASSRQPYVVPAQPPSTNSGANSASLHPILRQLAGDASSANTAATDSVQSATTTSRRSRLDDSPSTATGSAVKGGPTLFSYQSDAQVDDLRKKVEQQRMELDNRTDNVNAIQRNFQRLSEMYSTDRQKLVDAETLIATLQDELAGLRSERKLFAALRVEYTKLQAELEALRAQTDAERTKSQSQLKKLEEALRSSERESRGLSASLHKISKDLQDRQSEDSRMSYVAQDMETNFNTLLLGCLSWQKELADDADATRAAQGKAEVGKGIGFVAGSSGRAAPSLPGVVADGIPLRIETISRSALEVHDAALPALKRLVALRSDDLRQEFDAARAALAATIVELESKLLEATSATRESQARFSDLEAKARQLVSTHQFEVSELHQKIRALEEEVSRSHRSGDSALAAAQASLEDVRKQLATSERQRAEENTAAADRQLVLQEQVRRAECERDDHQHAATASRSALDQAKRDAAASLAAEAALRARAESESKQLGSQVRALTEANALLERQMKDSLRNADASNAARMSGLEQQLLQARAAQNVAEANAKTVGEELQRTANLLLESKRAYDAAEQQRRQLHDTVEALKTSVRDAEVRIAELMAERSQLLMDHHHQDDSLASTKAQLQQYQQQFTKLQGEKAVLENDCKRLRDDLQRVSASGVEVEALTAKVKSLQSEAADLKCALLNASALSQIHQDKIQRLSKEKLQLETQLAETKRFADSILGTQATFDLQRAALESQRIAAENRLKHLNSVQVDTLKTVKKLLNVEKACESGYSCQSCLQLLKDPVTCAPCGHVYCRQCFEGDAHNRDRKSKGTYCPECDENHVTTLVPSKPLDLLTGKFQYRCQVLNDLCALLEKDMLNAETDS